MENKIFFPIRKKIKILSLGAESVGVFAFYDDGDIFISENFGDILQEENFEKFKSSVLNFIKKRNLDVIITDLHPFYNSAIFGRELSLRLKTKHLKIQHHIAHIFSAVGDCMLNSEYLTLNIFYGIASDGTGYGFDENIWGGEVLQVEKVNFKNKNHSSQSKNKQCKKFAIKRIGSLEQQIMIGGDLAVKEPARMVIGILNKFLSKERVYDSVKKYYSKNEFELLYNQLRQNFNCQMTTSTGRIFDTVSVLLGFAKNQRNSKHEAIKFLEKNSTISYKLKPEIIFNKEKERHILLTTPLFEYLIKNIHKDKKRLAMTAQEYVAKGFYEIIKMKTQQYCTSKAIKNKVFFSGGMANNRIMFSYFKKKKIYISKKIPHGDEGISFGQIVYYLLDNY